MWSTVYSWPDDPRRFSAVFVSIFWDMFFRRTSLHGVVLWRFVRCGLPKHCQRTSIPPTHTAGGCFFVKLDVVEVNERTVVNVELSASAEHAPNHSTASRQVIGNEHTALIFHVTGNMSCFKNINCSRLSVIVLHIHYTLDVGVQDCRHIRRDHVPSVCFSARDFFQFFERLTMYTPVCSLDIYAVDEPLPVGEF